jgi:hypothetical protein
MPCKSNITDFVSTICFFEKSKQLIYVIAVNKRNLGEFSLSFAILLTKCNIIAEEEIELKFTGENSGFKVGQNLRPVKRYHFIHNRSLREIEPIYFNQTTSEFHSFICNTIS